MRARITLLSILAAGRALAAGPADSAQQKLDLIQGNQAKPGSTVVFTPAEVNAWAHASLPALVPTGVRNDHLDLGTDVITATGLVDFLKVREGLGTSTGTIMSKLLQGERPIKAVVRVASSKGRVTVYLTRVEMSGAAATGTVLDFLVQNVVKEAYPAAKIDEPIELGYRIDRIEVRPTGVRVTILP